MAKAKLQMLDPVTGQAVQAMSWEDWKKEKILFRHVAYILVFNAEKNKILLQHRSSYVQLFPNYWDPSASGSVDEGETAEEAAKRETFEEIGVQITSLEKIGFLGFDLPLCKQYQTVFTCFLATYEGKLSPNEEEVKDLRWYTFEEADQIASSEPCILTPNFQDAWKRFYRSRLLQ